MQISSEINAHQWAKFEDSRYITLAECAAASSTARGENTVQITKKEITEDHRKKEKLYGSEIDDSM